MATLPVYTVREKFDGQDGDRWAGYIRWSGLAHLSEVVSLDGILCPNPLGDISDEDWRHNVQRSNRLDLFHDLTYLLQRSATASRVNLLAVIDEPDTRSLEWSDPAFAFEGFDLVEDATGVSAVTNCGGWEGVLSTVDIGCNGLISTLERAGAIRDQLRSAFPNEPHANCVLWALWRRG